ncbi:MAG: 30S ribosome-binding factor RbfA [Acidimicrobiia bacterium]
MSRQGAHRYPRSARLNELVRECIADELERLSDPRLSMVTITGVDVSNDLRHATVYYSALGPKAQGWEASEADNATVADALQHAAAHFRAVLGNEVRMKYVPRLTFAIDPAIVQGRRIDAIIQNLHDHGPEAADDAEG